MDTLRARHEDALFKLSNVVGVGSGKKIVKGRETTEQCIRVYVREKVPIEELFITQIIPGRIEGVKTDVIEVGIIEAQENNQRLRPARPGVSIGHYKITAGTLGCLVKDKDTGKVMILSNNHVLANSNNAKRGDVILQPGKYDGGIFTRDRIAILDRWMPIIWANWNPFAFWLWFKKRKDNYVDAAVALPNNPTMIDASILDIGIPKGVDSVKAGDEVQKSGRTTSHTTGTVIDTNATVTVNYSRKNPKPARFKNQIIFSAMSAGGDSGSAILTMQNKVCALLFAGSKKITIGSPIRAVLETLNVDLVV